MGKLTIGREVAGITGYGLFHLHLLVDMIGALFDFGSAGFRDLRDMLLPQIIRRAAVAEGAGSALRGYSDGDVRVHREAPWFHGISADVEQPGGAAHPPVPSGIEVMRGKHFLPARPYQVKQLATVSLGR